VTVIVGCDKDPSVISGTGSQRVREWKPPFWGVNVDVSPAGSKHDHIPEQ